MRQRLITTLGKSVRTLAQLRGGGSALPGLVVERIDPGFIARTLAPLPYGVVVVSGTNGKTTTTKIVVELLESQGLKVFTNRTGSNFTRGVAAALLGEVNTKGVLPADIAVLELDEAHAVHFVRAVKPRHSLLLNVLRDQLDRFGEIDTTASFLKTIAEATTDTVVVNREDSRLREIGNALQNVHYFGLSQKLRNLFPSDEALHHEANDEDTSTTAATCTLETVGATSHYTINGETLSAQLKLEGVYNQFNAAGALALIAAILPKAKATDLAQALSAITPAFGRGESVIINGQPVDIVLVKNPSGFRLALSSFPAENTATMIAINDNYADGRDMSWLWDVDFSSLATHGVAMVGGVRAHDMALRLSYDDISVDAIETQPKLALAAFLKTHEAIPKRIYCTYTAMLAIRRELAKQTDIEDVL